MSENNVRILYREIVGAGDDEESNLPNGIVVTLAFFPSDDWHVPAHYLLKERVMIDRHYVWDKNDLILSERFQSDAIMLRKAIARMDTLKLNYPETLEAEREQS